MVCAWETEFKEVAFGQEFTLYINNSFRQARRIEPQENISFNAVTEEGKLVTVDDDTVVTVGYGYDR